MTPDISSNNDIEDQIHALRQRIDSKEEFLELLNLLGRDATLNLKEWENDTVERYIKAMSAWAKSMENYYCGQSIDIDTSKPSWGLFADLLLAARVYE